MGMLSRLESIFSFTPIQYLGRIYGIDISVKREDMLHPGLSGNKFWKLKVPLSRYLASSPISPEIISFGGAWSNHLHACSFLGPLLGIGTRGIIRGEELAKISEDRWSHTLQDMKKNGMKLEFVTRESYRNKKELYSFYKNKYPDALIIPEGGNSAQGREGVAGMLPENIDRFSHIAVPVGTGTTIEGLKQKFPEKKFIGFISVKDKSLYPALRIKNISCIDASLGGFGKINKDLIHFINEFEYKFNLPLDPIYTGKMMFQLWNQLEKGNFEPGSHILVLHTGGLQGKRSLFLP